MHMIKSWRHVIPGMQLVLLVACTVSHRELGHDAGPEREDGGQEPGDPTCWATPDCSEDIARDICDMPSETDCKVCVQDVDAQGKPLAWLAQENASHCPCPEPRVRAEVDASPGPGLLGPDAGTDAGDDCSSGTWDCTLETARGICSQQAGPCRICQLAADASVNPGSYVVLEFAHCDCPKGTSEAK